jgi:hypothetical protein
MTVYASKPEINVREKLKELDKPSGVAGEAMLRANTPQEQFNLIKAGRKNLLRNSQFMISQRGDFQTNPSSISAGTPTFGPDGWFTYGNGATTSQQVLNTILPTGERVKSHKTILTDSVTATWLHPGQKIEPEYWMRGQPITLSSWVKTNVPGYKLRICDTVNCYMIGDEIPADGKWHYVTATHTLPLGMALHEDSTTNNIQIQPAFQTYGQNLVQNSSFVEFALMQAEIGPVATPFEYRTYAEEWQICQRYYQRFGATDVPATTDYTGIATAHGSNSAWYVPIVLPGGRMRIAPSLSFSAAGDFRCTLQHSDSDPVTSIGYGYNNQLNPMLSVQAGSNGANRTRIFGWSGTTTAWLAFSAEWV